MPDSDALVVNDDLEMFAVLLLPLGIFRQVGGQYDQRGHLAGERHGGSDGDVPRDFFLVDHAGVAVGEVAAKVLGRGAHGYFIGDALRLLHPVAEMFAHGVLDPQPVGPLPASGLEGTGVDRAGRPAGPLDHGVPQQEQDHGEQAEAKFPRSSKQTTAGCLHDGTRAFLFSDQGGESPRIGR